MFYFTMKSPHTSAPASNSSLESDLLVEYEVSYLAYCNYCIDRSSFRKHYVQCAGNTPVDGIVILI